MRTTIALNDTLLAKAQAFTGPTEKSALVREALKALIVRESAHRLALLGGSEPELEPVPRRQSEQMCTGRYIGVVDHLRYGDSTLGSLLNTGQVLTHPFVIGELALVNLQQRDVILDTINNMPRAKIATDEEVLAFINQSKLYGLGIGYIDAHLLTSARLTPGTQLRTQDKRLSAAANRLRLLAALEH
jgi:hypothetical protein